MSTRATRAIAIFSLLVLGALLGRAGAAASAPPPAVADPADWPMYGHDIARTNFNPAETTINAGNVSQLVQRWQANIGSNGTPSSSGPVVSDGVLYAGSSAANGPNYFAFNAVSGSPVWARSLGYRDDCLNVGIGSTAAVSGTLLVVGADNDAENPAYYGLDTVSGTTVWTNTMDVGESGFPWESPLNDYGRTYLGMASRCDNPSVRGEVRAADLSTGATLDSQYFVAEGEQGGGIWNSPVMSPDHSVLIVATGEDFACTDCSLTRSMVSLDPVTLQILQHYQEGGTGQDLDYGTTPVIFHDAAGRGLVAANHKDGTLYAFQIANIDAGPVWSRRIDTYGSAMPAYDHTFGDGGTLFAEGAASQLYALDPATGANRWTAGSVTAGYRGNLAIANGLLFINTGSSLQIRSEADGSLLRAITPQNPGSSNSGVAVSHGFIYWVSGSYVNAWSLPAGSPTPTRTPHPHPPTATAPPVTRTVIGIGTPVPPTTTPPPGATATPTAPPGPSSTPAATETPCGLSFGDVHPTDYFYQPVEYLACHGVIAGYADGTFRPYNAATRAQMVKIVVRGFGPPIVTPSAGGYTFADVPPDFPFFDVIEAAAAHNVVSGYACGGPGERCDAQNRPYFRPYANVTRGQLAKIVTIAVGWDLQNPATGSFADVLPGSAFYTFVETAVCHGAISGYDCGGPGEPCDPQNRPYFRQGNDATRGQIAKIVVGALTGGTACAGEAAR